MWPLAAFMNEDIERPTAARIRIGMYLIVRASRDLKKGEELLMVHKVGRAAREGKSEEELRRETPGKTKGK
jgi:hypothetical protein